MHRIIFLAACVTAAISPLSAAADFDVIIRGGMVFDGSGGDGKRVDVAIRGDRIAGVGDFKDAKAKSDRSMRSGLAVAPGFINMLSWSTESLIEDGRSQSEIRQGVTTEIMGEGESMGPVNDRVKEKMLREQKDIHYEIKWNDAGGISALISKRAAFPATSPRSSARPRFAKTSSASKTSRRRRSSSMQMRELVRQEMEAGALGIGTSLIYPPAFYAKTEELIELCKVAAKYQGKYISHMRSEGNQLLEALDELIRISREAKIPAEIYHIKAAGEQNWPKAG